MLATNRFESALHLGWRMAWKTLVAGALVLSAAPALAMADTARFDIPAEPMPAALKAFAAQAHMQLLYQYDAVATLRGNPVVGEQEKRDALQRLILNTGLEAVFSGDNAATIRPAKTNSETMTPPDTSPGRSRDSTRSADKSTPDGIRLAQANQGTPASSPSVARKSDQAPEQRPVATLEEVLVTAQKREERLQDVPISVSVFSQAAMDEQGLRSIDDLSRLTPGVIFLHGTNNNNPESTDIAIRGIDSNAGASTTGIYIDDTPIQSRHLSFGTFNTYPALFDIDRVEVLRGPQGTLFGSGSEGGTVRFITPEPSLKQDSVYIRSEVAATAHGDPVYELGAAGGGPLVDDLLGIRAAVSYRHEGGYVDRYDWVTQQVTDKNSNSNKTVTARIAIKWAPTESLSITPSVYYQKRDVDDSTAWWVTVPGPADPTNGQFASPFRNGNSVAQPSTDKFVLSALKLDWNLPSVRLVSSTSYFKRDQSATTDYTPFDTSIFLGTPFRAPPLTGVGTGYWTDSQENLTQEVRLESADANAGVKWTTGIFYQRAKESAIQNVSDPALLALFGDTVDQWIYAQDPFSSTDTQLALFGQADVKLTEQLKLTLGLRMAKADYEGTANYIGFVVGPAVSSTGSITEHPVTPKIGLGYQIDPDNLVYATAAKGYRIGGSNAAVGQGCYVTGGGLPELGLTAVPSAYSSDSLWSYEVGTKNMFAERRVVLNASAYLIKWKNIQQNVGLACGFQFTGNLGEAQSKGFDLQLQGRVTDALSLGGAFGYTDAYYTQNVYGNPLDQTGFTIVQDGDHIPGSPWTLTLFSQLTFPVLGRNGYVRADFQYGAKQTDVTPGQNPLNNGSPSYVPSIPSQSYTTLRAGVKAGGVDLSLFAQNVFDSHPKLSAAEDGVNGAPLFYAVTWRPRTIGLTATYHY